MRRAASPLDSGSYSGTSQRSFRMTADVSSSSSGWHRFTTRSKRLLRPSSRRGRDESLAGLNVADKQENDHAGNVPRAQQNSRLPFSSPHSHNLIDSELSGYVEVAGPPTILTLRTTDATSMARWADAISVRLYNPDRPSSSTWSHAVGPSHTKQRQVSVAPRGPESHKHDGGSSQTHCSQANTRPRALSSTIDSMFRSPSSPDPSTSQTTLRWSSRDHPSDYADDTAVIPAEDTQRRTPPTLASKQPTRPTNMLTKCRRRASAELISRFIPRSPSVGGKPPFDACNEHERYVDVSNTKSLHSNCQLRQISGAEANIPAAPSETGVSSTISSRPVSLFLLMEKEEAHKFEHSRVDRSTATSSVATLDAASSTSGARVSDTTRNFSPHTTLSTSSLSAQSPHSLADNVDASPRMDIETLPDTETSNNSAFSSETVRRQRDDIDVSLHGLAHTPMTRGTLTRSVGLGLELGRRRTHSKGDRAGVHPDSYGRAGEASSLKGRKDYERPLSAGTSTSCAFDTGTIHESPSQEERLKYEDEEIRKQVLIQQDTTKEGEREKIETRQRSKSLMRLLDLLDISGAMEHATCASNDVTGTERQAYASTTTHPKVVHRKPSGQTVSRLLPAEWRRPATSSGKAEHVLRRPSSSNCNVSQASVTASADSAHTNRFSSTPRRNSIRLAASPSMPALYLGASKDEVRDEALTGALVTSPCGAASALRPPRSTLTGARQFVATALRSVPSRNEANELPTDNIHEAPPPLSDTRNGSFMGDDAARAASARSTPTNAFGGSPPVVERILPPDEMIATIDRLRDEASREAGEMEFGVQDVGGAVSPQSYKRAASAAPPRFHIDESYARQSTSPSIDRAHSRQNGTFQPGASMDDLARAALGDSMSIDRDLRRSPRTDCTRYGVYGGSPPFLSQCQLPVVSSSASFGTQRSLPVPPRAPKKSRANGNSVASAMEDGGQATGATSSNDSHSVHSTSPHEGVGFCRTGPLTGARSPLSPAAVQKSVSPIFVVSSTTSKSHTCETTVMDAAGPANEYDKENRRDGGGERFSAAIKHMGDKLESRTQEMPDKSPLRLQQHAN